MRQFVGSLAIGTGVGVIYGLLRFRSPAPPLIALVGLLGMLIGEQAVGLVRSRFGPPAGPVTAPTPSSQPEK